jgi:hypothetical protein
MATALFRPLTAESGMQQQWLDGRKMEEIADQFIKPSAGLSSFERLEIYNRQYWFRVLDSFYEDYPGLRAVLGEPAFLKMAEAYLVKYPSASFTLRNLGSRLVTFLQEEPRWAGKKLPLALDVVRFEWAQIVAFDGEGRPATGGEDLLGRAPEELQLGLQPFLTLLALGYPVDDFVLSVKRHEALRKEASNALDSAPKGGPLNQVPLPKAQKTFIAVHRHENSVYYKRLEPEAFALLSALRKGETLARACDHAFRRASPEVDWQKKIEDWFGNWSALGWFCQAPEANA